MSGLRVKARLALRFEGDRDAADAQAALAPESEGFLELRRDAGVLWLEVSQGTLGRVLATVDDALACLQAAGGTKEAAGGAQRAAGAFKEPARAPVERDGSAGRAKPGARASKETAGGATQAGRAGVDGR